MRLATLLVASVAALAAISVAADTISLPSPVSAVTIYPEGAKITRSVNFPVPAGHHDLVLTDLPETVDLDSLDIRIDGVRAGAITVRTDDVPPRGDTRSPETVAAEDRIEAIERQIAETRDRAAFARHASDAAAAQIGFLSRLGSTDDAAAAGIDALRGLNRMIGEEVLAARRAAQAAEIEARGIERALEDQERELADARQALAALTQDSAERIFVSIAVDATADTDATLTLSYFTYDADWSMVYGFHLTRGAAAALRIERGAFVRQNTGETWRDVALTLSTIQPTSQIAPNMLYPHLRRIEDPEPVRRKSDTVAGQMLGEPAIEAPVMVEEVAAANFDGYAVTYVYPGPVTVTTDADAVRLKLDTLTTRADIVARAIPLYDRTAFLEAHIVNDTQQIILGSEHVGLYVDDAFVGLTRIDSIVAGAKADLPFGPIEGLRLNRFVLNRTAGDKGILSSSNQQTETVRIEIENLTRDTWPVRLLDQVPYSEQDDLAIAWTATPKPAEIDVDNKRGILGWDLTLPPGASKTVDLIQTLSWPQDKVLR